MKIVSSSDYSIKKISGKILLQLYVLQREQGSIKNEILRFDKNYDNKDELTRSSLGKQLYEIANSSVPDVYNSLLYLYEKGFISFTDSKDTGGEHFLNIRVIAGGIDIIEGVERGEKAREQFNLNFNFTIDSLIKADIENAVKVSLI